MLDSIFPHVGELILERMLREKPELVTEKLGVKLNDVVDIHRQLPMLFPESDIIFDGFSTIDLAIELKSGLVFPIEVKLGKTGLTKASVDKVLLPCSISSHLSEQRVSGKVFSVLNRNYDDSLKQVIGESKLSTRVNGRVVPVSDEWGIIARQEVIFSWENRPPKFNNFQTCLSVNDICKEYGKNNFNSLVSEVFSNVNYYEEWLY